MCRMVDIDQLCCEMTRCRGPVRTAPGRSHQITVASFTCGPSRLRSGEGAKSRACGLRHDHGSLPSLADHRDATTEIDTFAPSGTRVS